MGRLFLILNSLRLSMALSLAVVASARAEPVVVPEESSASCPAIYAELGRLQDDYARSGKHREIGTLSGLIQKAKDRLRQELMNITGSHHPSEYAAADHVYRELNSYLPQEELVRRVQKQITRTLHEIRLYPELRDGYLEAAAALRVKETLLQEAASRASGQAYELPLELRPLNIELIEDAAAAMPGIKPHVTERAAWLAQNQRRYAGWSEIYKKRQEILETIQGHHKEKGIEPAFPLHIPLPTGYVFVDGSLRPSDYRFFTFTDKKEFNYTLDYFERTAKKLDERKDSELDFEFTTRIYAPRSAYVFEPGAIERERKANQAVLSDVLGRKGRPGRVQELDIDQARRFEILKIIHPDLEASGLQDVARSVEDFLRASEAYEAPPAALQALRKHELSSEWNRLKDMMAETSPGAAVRRLQDLHKVIWKFKMVADYGAIGAALFYLGRYMALQTDFLGYDERTADLDRGIIQCITAFPAASADHCAQGLPPHKQIKIAGKKHSVREYATQMNIAFRNHVQRLSQELATRLAPSAPASVNPDSVTEAVISYLKKADDICDLKNLNPTEAIEIGEHLELVMSCYAFVASEGPEHTDALFRAVSLRSPDAANGLAKLLEQRTATLDAEYQKIARRRP